MNGEWAGSGSEAKSQMTVPFQVTIRERGPTPRKFRKAFTNSAKEAWFETGVYYQANFTDERFTHRHATLAGYAKRSPRYEKRKRREQGHTYPLVKSGRTRMGSRRARIVSTSGRLKISWPNVRALNFRNPTSQINTREEFTKVLPSEQQALAGEFDRVLDMKLSRFIN